MKEKEKIGNPKQALYYIQMGCWLDDVIFKRDSEGNKKTYFIFRVDSVYNKYKDLWMSRKR